MNIPAHLKYTKEHEWVSVDGDVATVGITDFAQSQLGDIVFVEMPEKGAEVRAGESFGVVESIKSVSDLYAPVSGEVVGCHEALEEAPEELNSAPYESWIIRVRLSNPGELEALLSPEDYANCCEE